MFFEYQINMVKSFLKGHVTEEMQVKITFYNTSQYKIAVFVQSSFKNGSAYDCSIYIGLIYKTDFC